MNKELDQKVVDAKVEAKRLRAKAFIADEVIDAFRVRRVEIELRVGLFTTENEEMKKEVHLCKSEVNAMMKQV